ncbi:hypothetical protein BDB01DRAFT_807749 [Pilobolus umbonatus]|nr:hypothetical protein BDB01DRAFT_807749 [Pilobolus umbonatus]
MASLQSLKAPSLISRKTKQEDEDDVVIDTTALPSRSEEDVNMEEDTAKPTFAPAAMENKKVTRGSRKIPIPSHRMSPLKRHWLEIYSALVEHMKLQVRMNIKSQTVELKTSPSTEDEGALQKGADFVRAFALGFEVEDAMALLRLDDIFLDTFEIKDVKTLHGDHLSRAIGRIAGRDGKTKFTIENASKTRIVLADTKIHILGSFQNIKIARDAVVHLILGSPPGKVYATLRTISARMKERF